MTRPSSPQTDRLAAPASPVSSARLAPSALPVPAPGITYGYARVSSRDQNLDRQLDALAEFGVDPAHILADKASGKDFDRPAYRSLMERLAARDTLVIASIDRLGRNYNEILSEWRRITQDIGAAIVVLDMPLLDTRGRANGSPDGSGGDDLTGAFIADIVLQLLSYVAQIERENIRHRQAQGIAAAKARGVRFGRPALQRPASYDAISRAHLDGRMSRVEAARLLGVSPHTFDKWLAADCA